MPRVVKPKFPHNSDNSACSFIYSGDAIPTIHHHPPPLSSPREVHSDSALFHHRRVVGLSDALVWRPFSTQPSTMRYV